MSEFAAELRARLNEVREEIRRAEAEGDDYRIEVHTGRLDNLMRLAAEHGIDVDEVRPPEPKG